MASTDMITYLNYVSTWETESDENLDSLIREQNLFTQLGDFESDTFVDKEFAVLNDLAVDVRDNTIEADAIQVAADAAAVASIWTFGFGMAAFAALETAESLQKGRISSKSGDLMAKLKTADTDISSQINQHVNDYVTQYKANNDLIVSKAPVGLDTRTCRALLMQFLGSVQRRNRTLDAAALRKYAGSARLVYNSPEIGKVYDALDQLNLSAKSDADVTQFLDVLKALPLPDEQMRLIQGVATSIMSYKLKVANDTIESCAKATGLPVEELDASAFGMIDVIGKVATVFAVVLSAVDVVLEIINIVSVVEQCNKMCDELNTTIKDSYKTYFNGIRTASQQYNAALAASPAAA